jgi:hypothetical protein
MDQVLKNWRKALDGQSREQLVRTYGIHSLLLGEPSLPFLLSFFALAREPRPKPEPLNHVLRLALSPDRLVFYLLCRCLLCFASRPPSLPELTSQDST